MSKALVIGGTLFIGRALVRQLLAAGHEVTIIHRGSANPFAGQVGDLHCDRNDSAGLADILRTENPEWVFDNVYDWQRGTTGEHVRAAAEACGDRLARYVFMSSCAAYGSGLDLAEDAPLAPPGDPDLYCRNKADSERALFAMHHETGFPVATLRPPYVYGPENPFYREAFFWDRLTAGRPVIVPADGSRLMQFALASDLARAAVLAAQTPAAVGKAFNVADAKPLTQAELVAALAQAAGIEPETKFVPREKLIELGGGQFAPPYYFAQYFDMPPITEDVSRARQLLGFEPTPFDDGLRQAFEWYQGRPDTADPGFSFDDKILASIT